MKRRTFIQRSLQLAAVAGVAGVGGLRFIGPAAGQVRPRYEVVTHQVGEIGPESHIYGRPADSFHALNRFRPGGNVEWSIGQLGTEPGEFNGIAGVGLNEDLGRLYVVDSGNHRVQVFTPDGEFLFQFGSAGSAEGQFNSPSELVIGSDGLIYICDTLNHRIQVFSPDGQFVRAFGSLGTEGAALNGPEGLAFHPDGTLHVVDSGNARIQKYSPAGEYRGSYGSYGTEVGQFLYPQEIAIDQQGWSYVTDPVLDFLTIFRPESGEAERIQLAFEDGLAAAPMSTDIAPDGTIYIGAVVGEPDPVAYMPFLTRGS